MVPESLIPSPPEVVVVNAPQPTPPVSKRTRLLQAKTAVSEGADLLRAKAKSMRDAIGEMVKAPGDPEAEANAKALFAEFVAQSRDLAAAQVVLDSLKGAGE